MTINTFGLKDTLHNQIRSHPVIGKFPSRAAARVAASAAGGRWKTISRQILACVFLFPFYLSFRLFFSGESISRMSVAMIAVQEARVWVRGARVPCRAAEVVRGSGGLVPAERPARAGLLSASLPARRKNASR